MGTDAGAVTGWLCDGVPDDAAATYAEWVAELDRIGPSRHVAPDPGPTVDPRLGTEALSGWLIDRLGFAPDDAAETVASRIDPERDPQLWWLLERSHRQLLAGLGDVDARRWWSPHLPEHAGAKGRYFYVRLLLATLPAVLDYHAGLGIDETVSWATFADLGRQIAIHRRLQGRGGLDTQFWFGLHFRGLIFDFGRLQLNRSRVEHAPDGVPFGDGELVLGVHIPESGPMTPEACDASFAMAKQFFARYFPDEPYRYATCNSWLLDDQLADYLPAESNIVRFQRRFELAPDAIGDGDGDVFQFVFRRDGPDLASLPRRTTLERAIVRHLEAGGHWRTRIGWLEL